MSYTAIFLLELRHHLKLPDNTRYTTFCNSKDPLSTFSASIHDDRYEIINLQPDTIKTFYTGTKGVSISIRNMILQKEVVLEWCSPTLVEDAIRTIDDYMQSYLLWRGIVL